VTKTQSLNGRTVIAIHSADSSLGSLIVDLRRIVGVARVERFSPSGLRRKSFSRPKEDQRIPESRTLYGISAARAGIRKVWTACECDQKANLSRSVFSISVCPQFVKSFRNRSTRIITFFFIASSEFPGTGRN
jgi:hypothetical protein